MKPQRRENFFVITGCSGGGKSSIIDELAARGFQCAEEAGRTIVKQQLSSGGDTTPWQNPAKFVDLIVARYVELFDQVTETRLPVFFDRGIPEGIAASHRMNIPVPAHYRAAAERCLYARKVFIAPPWQEIYETDAERRHSFEDGLADYPFTLAAYRECGYELIEIPKAPVPQRADFILRQVVER